MTAPPGQGGLRVKAQQAWLAPAPPCPPFLTHPPTCLPASLCPGRWLCRDPHSPCWPHPLRFAWGLCTCSALCPGQPPSPPALPPQLFCTSARLSWAPTCQGSGHHARTAAPGSPDTTPISFLGMTDHTCSQVGSGVVTGTVYPKGRHRPGNKECGDSQSGAACGSPRFLWLWVYRWRGTHFTGVPQS